MKKLITLLSAAVCAAALCAFAGCSDDNFTEKTYLSGDSEVKQIVVDVADRELQISPSEDGQVHIDYFDGEKEYLEITCENSRLTVQLAYDKSWTDFIGVKASDEYRKIEMLIPDDVIVDFSAQTTNENIRVTSLSFAESLTLNSNGGDVICERVNVGKSIDLTAKNGNITGTILGTLDEFSISCTFKKGDCNLPAEKESGTKSFTADCNNGDINIEFVGI